MMLAQILTIIGVSIVLVGVVDSYAHDGGREFVSEDEHISQIELGGNGGVVTFNVTNSEEEEIDARVLLDQTTIQEAKIQANMSHTFTINDPEEGRFYFIQTSIAEQGAPPPQMIPGEFITTIYNVSRTIKEQTTSYRYYHPSSYVVEHIADPYIIKNPNGDNANEIYLCLTNYHLTAFFRILDPDGQIIHERDHFSFSNNRCHPQSPEAVEVYTLNQNGIHTIQIATSSARTVVPTDEQYNGTTTLYLEYAHSTDDPDGQIWPTHNSRFNYIQQNRAPVPAPIEDFLIDENDPVGFQLSATDDDPGDDESLTYQHDLEGATIDETNRFSWQADESHGGMNLEVTITVTDEHDGIGTETFTITVRETNEDPVLTVPDPVTIPPRIEYEFTANATDEDEPEQTLTFSMTNAPMGATINSTTGAFSWTPGNRDAGTYTFDITVTDNMGGSATEQVTVIVAVPENNPPVLMMIADITVDEDETVTIRPQATDTDEDPLTYRLVRGTLPAAATFDTVTGYLDWTTTEQDGGSSHDIDIIVSDGRGGSAFENITITVNEINHDPVFDAVRTHHTLEPGTALAVDLNAQDQDEGPTVPDQVIRYSLPVNPVGAEINEVTGLVIWPPSSSHVGNEYSLTARVVDGHGGTDELTIHAVVISEGDLEMEPISDQNVTALSTLRYDVMTSGGVGPGTYDAVPIPRLNQTLNVTLGNGLNFIVDPPVTGASIDGGMGHLVYVPPANQTGPQVIAVRAADNASATLGSFIVNVGDPIATIDELTLGEGSITLRYTAGSDLLESARINKNNMEVQNMRTVGAGGSSFPITSQVGSGWVYVIRNGTEWNVDGNIYIDDSGIIANPFTTPPNEGPRLRSMFGALGGYESPEHEPFFLQIPILDDTRPNGDLQWSLVENTPSGVEVVPTGPITSEIRWTPSEEQGGPQYTISVQITDGVGGDPLIQRPTVTVIETNEQPRFDDIQTRYGVDVGDQFTLDLNATDSDIPVQTLSYSLSSETVGPTINGETGVISWATSAADIGNHEINATVSDGQGGSDSKILMLQVRQEGAPAAPDESYTIMEDSGDLTITPAISDSEGTATITAITMPTLGTATHTNTTITYTPNPDMHGTETIIYTVTDNDNIPAEGTITITITSVNDPPVAPDVTETIMEDSPATTITPAISDDGTATITAITTPTLGTATHTNTTITYTPNEDQHGTDEINYTVTDNDMATATGTITITIESVNDPPTAPPESRTIPEDSEAIDVTPSIMDDGTFSIISALGATLGTAVTDGSTITYDPHENQSGTDTITYTVRDSGNVTVMGIITITITPVNDAPGLTAPMIDPIPEEMLFTITLEAMDIDNGTDELTFGADGAPAGVDVSGDQLSWTPTEAQGPGDYMFSITVTDGIETVSQAVTITVTEVNQDPVLANIGDRDVQVDTEDRFTATATDDDIPAQTLTFGIVNAPEGATMMPNGMFSWTPNVADTEHTFNVTVSDGQGGSDSQEVTITVTRQPPPTVENVMRTIPEDSEAITITPDIMDDDPNPIITGVTNGTFGTATHNETTITYTPNPNAHGTDMITYTVTDDDDDTATGTITITITSVNDLPSAPDETATTPEDTAITITPDIMDDGTVTITSVTNGTFGTVMFNATTITYTPNPDVHDTDTITYTVQDNDGTVVGGSIMITIESVNDLPVAPNVTQTIPEDSGATTITPAIEDVEGTPTITAITMPTLGTAIHTTTTITYTPNTNENGQDTITYTVTDNNGADVNGTITITIESVNDAPVLEAIDDITVNEDDSVEIRPTASDVDDDTLTFSLERGTLPAEATFNPANGHLNWTTTESDGGTSHQINITVSDGNGGSDSETVTITVTETNQDPMLDNINAISVQAGNMTTFTATATDDDTPVQMLTYSITDTPASATIGADDGVFMWTPVTADIGPNTFNVTVSDGNGGSDSQEVTITVTNQPPPEVENVMRTIPEDSEAITITPDIVDDDPNPIITGVTNGTLGTATTNGTAITYAPNEDANGDDTITYTVTDDDGDTATGTITITITPVNDAPGLTAPMIDPIPEEMPFTITLEAMDIDNGTDELTFGADGAPAGVDVSRDQLSWTPTEAQGPGDYMFSITVTDGIETVSQAVTITVDEANQNPEFDDIQTQYITILGQEFTVDLNATDADIPEQALEYSIASQSGPGPDAAIDGQTGLLSWTPDASGNKTVTVRVQDNHTEPGADEITIAIAAGQVMADDDDVTIVDRDQVAIDVLANDMSQDSLVITDINFDLAVFASTAFGTLTHNGTHVIYTPGDAATGSQTLTYTIQDELGRQATGTVTITVQSDPVFDSIDAEHNATAGESFTLDVTATDANTPAQTISYNITSHNATGVPPTIDSATGTISWTPDTAETVSITVRASDDFVPAGTDDITITVTVSPAPVTNTAPVADDFGINVTRSGTVTVNLVDEGHISDAEQAGDTLAVSLDATNATQGQPDIQGVIFTYTANDNATGTDTLSYTVTDSGDLTDSATITVTILQPLPAPDIDVEAVPGILTSVRPDIGEGFTITETMGATMGTISEEFLADGTIAYTANAGASGIDEVTYMVSDGAGGTAQGTVRFYINAPDNERPVLETIPGVQTEEGTVTFQVMSADNDTQTYAIRNAPEGATINGTTGAFSWNTTGADPGDYIFNIVVHDGAGGLDVQKMAITVRDPANDNPTAPALHRRTTTDTSILIAPDIRDPEGQPTGMILAVGADKGIVSEGFLGANIIAYIPQEDGTDIISYTTSDGAGGAATSTVYVHTGTSADPDLDAIGVQRVETTQTLEFNASAQDADNSDILYIMDGAPVGATLDELTGEFSWTPGTADAGDHTFTITAYNSQGGFDTEPVAISVSEPGITNRDPNISDFDAAALQNNPRFIVLQTSDPDEDPTGIILATNATMGTIRQDLLQSGIIAYVPEPDQVGVDAITYAVSDRRGGVSTGTIYVHVRNIANDEPTLAPIGNRQVSVPDTLTFDVSASDNEGSPLTYAIRNAPEGATINNATGEFSWTPETSDAGDHTFTVTVSDGAGGFATEDILVTVTDPDSGNQPPTAPDGSATTAGDRTVILLDISDPDNDGVTIIDASGAILGLVDPEPLRDAIVVYTPFPGVSDVDTITYTVSDGQGGLTTGTITITINIPES